MAVKNEFFEFQQPTIGACVFVLPPLHVLISLPHLRVVAGAAFLTQTVPLDDVIVKFEIWDTAGQPLRRARSNSC